MDGIRSGRVVRHGRRIKMIAMPGGNSQIKRPDINLLAKKKPAVDAGFGEALVTG